MRLRDVMRLMSRVVDDPHPCKWGHPRCSDTDGGVCSHEMWVNQADDESDEYYADRIGADVELEDKR